MTPELLKQKFQERKQLVEQNRAAFFEQNKEAMLNLVFQLVEVALNLGRPNFHVNEIKDLVGNEHVALSQQNAQFIADFQSEIIEELKNRGFKINKTTIEFE